MTGSEKAADRPRSWVREIIVGVVVAVSATAVLGLLGLDGAERRAAPRPAPRPPRGTRITWEDYVRIKPGVSAWEVEDLLGSGEVVAEAGRLIDAHGRYREVQREGGRGHEETGTVRGHDGTVRREVEQVIRWSSADRLIEVTFVDGRVGGKREQGLH